MLTGDKLYITYYPDLINQVLDKINPYNMRVHCIASKFKELPNLETEQYYGTQFVEQLIDKNNLLVIFLEFSRIFYYFLLFNFLEFFNSKIIKN